MNPVGKSPQSAASFQAQAAAFMKARAKKPELQEQPKGPAEPAETFQSQAPPAEQPVQSAAPEQVQAPTATQAPQPAPELSKEQAQQSQEIAGNLILNQGRATMQGLNQLAQQDPAVGQVYQSIGKAANDQVQGSEHNFYPWLAQNLQQLGDASNMAAERASAGSQMPYGQMLAEEMKTQAEGMALMSVSPPDVAQSAIQDSEQLTTNAQASKGRQSVDLLKSRLPAETVKKALSDIETQPLYAAAEAAKSLPESSSTTLVNMSDMARSYLPLSMAAKGMWFGAAQGKGLPAPQQLAEIGKSLTNEMFTKGGSLDRVSPKFAQFAGSYIRKDGDPMQNGRQAATDLTVLLMGMEAGTQRAPMTGENRNEAIKNSVKSMVLQQGLRMSTSPMIQQSAMMQVQQGVPGPEPRDPGLAELLGPAKTPEDHLNRHMAAMLSPDQSSALKQGVQNHPLNQLADSQDLAKLQDSFELPYGGEARLRGTLAGYAGNLNNIAMTINQMNQPQGGFQPNFGNYG